MIFDFLLSLEKKIERDKNRLKYDLEHSGIKNLLLSMERHEPYSPHILERQRKGTHSSEDNISMIAYNVSTTLKDPALKPELLHLLGDPSYKEHRRNILCCLSILCSNTSDYELFDFLLNQLDTEEDERTIVSVLSRLAPIRKPRTKDISVIKRFLKEGTADIHQAAVQALANSEHEEVEDLLLDAFKTGNTHIKGMVCTPLQTLGTKKSIPVLQEAMKRTRQHFLQHQIECVLNEIGKREHG